MGLLYLAVKSCQILPDFQERTSLLSKNHFSKRYIILSPSQKKFHLFLHVTHHSWMNLATIETIFRNSIGPKVGKNLRFLKSDQSCCLTESSNIKSKTKIEIGQHFSNSFLILIYLISEILEAQVLYDILLIFYKQLCKN